MRAPASFIGLCFCLALAGLLSFPQPALSQGPQVDERLVPYSFLPKVSLRFGLSEKGSLEDRQIGLSRNFSLAIVATWTLQNFAPGSRLMPWNFDVAPSPWDRSLFKLPPAPRRRNDSYRRSQQYFGPLP